MKLSEYYKEKNYIHYSNCHEDFLLLEKYFTPNTRNILSVASGLDNSLSFLVHDNVKVHAFDFNPSQVFLCRLKIAAVKNFSHEQMLIFLGIKGTEKNARVELYRKLNDSITDDVKKYFDSHIFLIEEGIVNCGRFEQYFHIFRNRVFPAVCNEKDIKLFASAPDIETQRNIYRKKINTFRFKLMFSIFFSKTMMSKLGRDKDFFKYSRERVSSVLKKRVDTGFNSCLNKENPYYGYVLNSFYPVLPFYLEKSNFEKIKQNISNITVEQKTFDEMLCTEYDFMNLSDIFEYMDEKLMTTYSEKIKEHLTQNGRAAFWNMMNVRKLSGLKRINSESDFFMDRAFFYRDFFVYEK